MNGDTNAYKRGLSLQELIDTVRALLDQQRIADRLVCRYLADLAERIKSGSSPWSDVYHAARCLFGLSTRATRERVRIGRALRDLATVERAFLEGDLRYSQVRELTRVATPDTEAEWLKLAQELPIHQLERRVMEANGGAAAKDQTDEPARMTWTTPETVSVQLNLRAETWALLQRAMDGARRLADDTAGLLGQDEALAAVARDAIAHQEDDQPFDVQKAVVLYECRTCQRTELETGSTAIDLDPATAAALGCGARVRDLRKEGCIVKRGGKIPRSVLRAVYLRDRGRCRVPGCRRRRYVHVHHRDEQAKGGVHSKSNCMCLCSTHHRKLHEGELFVTGDAEGELVFTDAAGSRIVDPSEGRHGRNDPRGSRPEPLDQNAAQLLAVMGNRGGWYVDYLCDATGFTVDAVLDALLTLTMSGRVQEERPGVYGAVQLN